MIKNPLNLGGGKVSVYDKTCLFPYQLGHAFATQLVAIIRCTTVLPNNSIVNRLISLCVPHDSGLSLIGDTYAGYVFAIDVNLRDGFGNDGGLR